MRSDVTPPAMHDIERMRAPARRLLEAIDGDDSAARREAAEAVMAALGASLSAPQLLWMLGVAEEALRPGRAADDMATLIRQLAYSLKKARPDSDLPRRAMDYLRSKGLQGSILRDAPQEAGNGG